MSLISIFLRRLQRSQAFASRQSATRSKHSNANLRPEPSQYRCNHHIGYLCYSCKGTLRHRHQRNSIAKAASGDSDGHLEEEEEEEATRLASHVGLAPFAH